MIFNIVGLFVVNTLTLGIFMFGVPYWTGKEVAEISNSGFYQLFYTVCGTVGSAAYKIIEHVGRFICKIFRIHPVSTWYSTINLVMYIIAITLCNAAYNATMEAVIHFEPEEFKFVADSSYSKLSDIVLIFNIISQFRDASGLSGVLLAVGKSIFAVAFFMILTIFYFATMYGLLHHKVFELDLISRANSKAPMFCRDLLGGPEKATSLHEVPKALGRNAMEFVDGIVGLRNYKIGRTLYFFVPLLFMYSVVQGFRGETPNMLELVLDVLDEAEVINTLASFVLTALFTRTVVAGCRVVYEVLPDNARQKVDTASDKCKAAAEHMKQKRARWAEMMDGVYATTEGKIFSWKVKYAAKFRRPVVDGFKPMSRGQSSGVKLNRMSFSASSITEAYARECDYDAGDQKWTFCKGVLVQFWTYDGAPRVLLSSGEIHTIEFNNNPYGITLRDRDLCPEIE